MEKGTFSEKSVQNYIREAIKFPNVCMKASGTANLHSGKRTFTEKSVQIYIRAVIEFANVCMKASGTANLRRGKTNIH